MRLAGLRLPSQTQAQEDFRKSPFPQTQKALTPGLVRVSALTLFDVLLLDVSVYINNVGADEPLEFLQLCGLADVDIFSYWIHWTG